MMVGVLAVTGALAVGLVRVVSVVVAQHRAQTAADAAALAGVVAGATVAAEVAARNGATLLTWRWLGDDLVVEVRVAASGGDSVTATARATRAP